MASPIGKPNPMLALKRAKTGIVRVLLAMLAATWAAAVPACAHDSGEPSGYSQPAMPLADALRLFARTTGYDVVFQEALVHGRRSAAVDRARNAHQALAQLLEGSGLAPRFTRRDAFILERVGAQETADLTLERIVVASAADRAAYRWYGDKLLQRCLSTLRKSGEMGLRSYDFMIYVWLTEDGRVKELRSTGAADQSEVIRVASIMLKGLAVGTTPPANMPQPVGLRISAR